MCNYHKKQRKAQTMRLDIGRFTVRELRFATNTEFSKGVLSINRKELKTLLENDKKLKRVSIDIANPGDDTRIIHILDTVEPRVKLSGGGIFPGTLGPPLTVGEGRTNRLSGMAVVETAKLAPPQTGLLVANEAILDMSGVGAGCSPFSGFYNVVLSFEPADELAIMEYEASIRQAALKASVYLAETTRRLEPDKVDTYELIPVDSSLPKVIYIYLVASHGFLSDTLLYGKSVFGLTPTIIHPNEIMDGAIVSANYGGAGTRNPTYLHLNNPVIQQLYERHGKELNFLGVVLSWPGANALEEKERSSAYAAKIAKLLGAQGVILTHEGAGHGSVDVMRICQRCEEMEMKVVIVINEMAGADGSDFGLVDAVPEANAIVSTGNRDEMIALPTKARVLGGDELIVPGVKAAPSESFSVTFNSIFGSTNQGGMHNITALQH
jgi:glycine reductase